MKIEIRLLDTIVNEHGTLLEIVETSASSFSAAQERVASRMIHHAIEQFGADNFVATTDTSIFGGYYRSKFNGDCVVAR